MPLRKSATAALTALAAAIGSTGLMAASADTASAVTVVNWPAHVFAPYADTWSSNITLNGVASSYGTKFFTIAFVDGAGCHWNIGQQSSLQSQISALRSQGGDVSISFGGYTTDLNLTEIGDACSTPQAAAAQIESVVTTFGVTHLDFDIEANSLTNSAGITRRSQALAQVRSWANSSGVPLSVSYTLPVLPSGLTGDGLNVVRNAVANGFTPDIVNGMAMDYGTSGTQMGNAADQAVDALAGQVAGVFGISTAAAYGRIGVTPMIGQNDSAGEIFTLGDASNLESYAASKGVALLSYWDQNRDNGGCPGQTSASGTCSGLSQNTGDFATTFQRFTGGGTSGGGRTGPVTSGMAGKCLDDFAGSSANGTKADLYSCNGTGAQQWTVASNGTLQINGKCLDITGAATGNGALVELWDCNGGGNQQWTARSGALVNPVSGRCLDDPGFSTTDGTQLDLWDCNGGVNQKWTTP
ncbi:hypothetical protein GCM10009839_01120 [Catenulispora yoronensis]|uniref:Ricin B lectin domain-containing protein n=1 Tax=Catenulispora yoronensis TaxID=450799 RepID=A0ABN2TIP5_9ACTN